MLPDYADIRRAVGVDREPLWYDENGVPRYEPFEPDMLGVYDKYALLVKIQCQSCLTPILVGHGWPSYGFLSGEFIFYDLKKFAEGYHYGDPPRHNCSGSGETMNCIDLQIIEAWEQIDHEWQRNAEIEAIDIYPTWAKE